MRHRDCADAGYGQLEAKLRERARVPPREESRWWELDTPELRRLVQSHGDMVNHPSVAALEAWRRDGRVSG